VTRGFISVLQASTFRCCRLLTAAASCTQQLGVLSGPLLLGWNRARSLKSGSKIYPVMTETGSDRSSADGWFQAGAISSSKNQPLCVRC